MIKYRGWAGKTEGEKPQKHAKNANICLLPKGLAFSAFICG